MTLNGNKGRTPSIANVTQCFRQMKKAEQQAYFRKLVPDAYDDNGNLKPGQLIMVLEAFAKDRPGTPYQW